MSFGDMMFGNVTHHKHTSFCQGFYDFPFFLFFLSCLYLSHCRILLHYCLFMFSSHSRCLSRAHSCYVTFSSLTFSGALFFHLHSSTPFHHFPPIIPLRFSAKPNHLTFFSFYPLFLSLHPSVPFLLSSFCMFLRHYSNITAVLSTPMLKFFQICYI